LRKGAKVRHETTVGAALRGRPWLETVAKTKRRRFLKSRVQTKGGHGGPPLQYFPSNDAT